MHLKPIMGFVIILASCAATPTVVQRPDGKTTILAHYTRPEDIARPRDGCYDDSSQQMFTYRTPPFAGIKKITLAKTRTGKSQLTIEMRAPIPARTRDRLTVEAYFDTPKLMMAVVRYLPVMLACGKCQEVLERAS